MLKDALVLKLKALAKKYETSAFLCDDPSQFMHRYSTVPDMEAAAFIAASLSFGKRELFISKLKLVFSDIDEKCPGASPVCRWLLGGRYKEIFPKNGKKFYRFFSYADLNALCGRLAEIIRQYGSLGAAVRLQKERLESAAEGGLQKNAAELLPVRSLISLFPGIKCVSQNAEGACKKLHMFLRWMVRRNSPVDLGLWTWLLPDALLIPLDVHVLKESERLGLLPEGSKASAKTAVLLTKTAAQIWPKDPARADFALFGLGVSKER